MKKKTKKTMPQVIKRSKRVSVCDEKSSCNRSYYGKNWKQCCKTKSSLKNMNKSQKKLLRTMGCCSYRSFAKKRGLPYNKAPKVVKKRNHRLPRSVSTNKRKKLNRN